MEGFGRSLALIIGINAYSNGIPPLKNAVSDARALANLLGDKSRYDNYDEVLLRVDQNATLLDIKELLESFLKDELKENDRLLFYFAGHGTTSEGEEGPVGYILPQDANASDPDTFLSMVDLHRALTELKCRHILIILDCCFAGAFRWAGTRHFRPLPALVYKQRYAGYIRYAARQVLSSATQMEQAMDLEAGSSHFRLGRRVESNGHSPFAKALLEGLAGAGDVVPVGKGDGLITANELYTYLRQRFENERAADVQAQTPGFWTLDKDSWGEYIFFVPGYIGPEKLADAPPLDPGQNPYRGLEPYAEQQRDLLFGRDDLVDVLTDQVCDQPLTVVLGPSGSGKTSVIQAGLIPKLRQRFDETCEILAPIRPSTAPLEALANLKRPNGLNLWQSLSAPTLVRDVALAEVVRTWSAANPEKLLFLIIDQLEELYLPQCSADERNQFLALLQAAVAAHPECLRVVLGLRSDHADAARFGSSILRSDLKPAICEVYPLCTSRDLRPAIEGPAAANVLYFESEEFVENLVSAVTGNPGGMPLLSLTMHQMYVELYEHWQLQPTSDRALTEELYQQFGGVTGLIQAMAQDAYAKLEADCRETMRRITLRMLEKVEGRWVAHRTAREELRYSSDAENQRVADVLDRLTAARLVVQSGDTHKGSFVELAHIALVDDWETLQSWIDVEQSRTVSGNLTFQHEVEQDVRKWIGAGRVKSELRTDGKRVRTLKEALTHEPSWLNQAETEYARQSIARARWLGWVKRAVAAVLVLLVFSVITVWQVDKYRGALLESETLYQQANNALTSTNQDPVAAIAYAVKALPRPDHQRPYAPEAEFILRQALLDTLERARVRVTDYLSDPEQIAFRGDAIAVGGSGLWLVKQALTETIPLVAAGRDAVRVAWNSDGLLLDYDYYFGREVRVWTEGRSIASQSFDAPILCARWQPKHSRIAICSGSTLWLGSPVNGGTHERLYDFPAGATVKDAIWSPDGQRLIAWDDNYDVLIWNPDAAEPLRLYTKAHFNFISTAVWSSDSRYAVTASADHSAKLWSIDAHDRPIPPMNHADEVTGAAFIRIAPGKDEPDDRLLTWGFDGQIRGWNMHGALLFRLPSGPNPVRGVLYRPDQKHLLIYTDQGEAQIWNLQTEELVAKLDGHKPGTAILAADWQGDYIVTGGVDSTARLWDAHTGEQLALLGTHTGRVLGVRWYDQIHVMTYGEDGSLRLWQVLDERRLPLCQGNTPKSSGNLPICFNKTQTFVGQAGDAQSARWRDNDTILLTGRSGTARRWSPGKDVQVVDPRIPLGQAVWDPEGKRVFTYQREFRGMETADGQIQTLGYDTPNVPVAGPISTAFWLEEGLFVSSEDGRLRRIDPDTGHVLADYQGHTLGISDISIAGQRLATAGLDGAIILWDLATGTRQNTLVLDEARPQVSEVRWDSTGTRLLAAGKRAARMWDIPDIPGNTLPWTVTVQVGITATWTYSDIGPNAGSDFHIAVSPDERYVALHGDRGIDVLETDSGEKVWSLDSPHGDNTIGGVQWVLGLWWPYQSRSSVAWDHLRQWLTGSPWRLDGQRLLLLSWGGDRTARLWDPEAEKEIWRGVESGPISIAAVNPTGTYVLTVSEYGVHRLWPLWLNQPDQLLDVAQAADLPELTESESAAADTAEVH